MLAYKRTLKKAYLFLIFYLLLIAFPSYASSLFADTTIDQKIKFKFTPLIDFDHRFSLVNHHFSNIWGVRLGINVTNNFKIGIGGYYLYKQLEGTYTTNNGTPLSAHAIRQLYFSTLFYEHLLFENPFFELSLPLEGGFGKSNFDVYTNAANEFIKSTSKLFIPIGLGLAVTYKLPALFGIKQFKWMGIKGLIGYRYCLFKGITPDFKVDYDGGFYAVSITLFLQQLIKDIKH